MPRQPWHSSNYGGRRPGAGRPPKSMDKYQRSLVRRAHEEGVHPFDFILKIMRNEKEDKKTRMYAAQALLPYCAAKLQQTELKVEGHVNNLTLSEKVALATSLRSEIVAQRPDLQLPELPDVEEEEEGVINGEAQRV